MLLPACNAISGTEIAYAATRCSATRCGAARVMPLHDESPILVPTESETDLRRTRDDHVMQHVGGVRVTCSGAE
eukprot:1159231-Rhodomonas_salina.2